MATAISSTTPSTDSMTTTTLQQATAQNDQQESFQFIYNKLRSDLDVFKQNIQSVLQRNQNLQLQLNQMSNRLDSVIGNQTAISPLDTPGSEKIGGIHLLMGNLRQRISSTGTPSSTRTNSRSASSIVSSPALSDVISSVSSPVSVASIEGNDLNMDETPISSAPVSPQVTSPTMQRQPQLQQSEVKIQQGGEANPLVVRATERYESRDEQQTTVPNITQENQPANVPVSKGIAARIALLNTGNLFQQPNQPNPLLALKKKRLSAASSANDDSSSVSEQPIGPAATTGVSSGKVATILVDSDDAMNTSKQERVKHEQLGHLRKPKQVTNRRAPSKLNKSLLESI